jgi:hypothetical protein
LGGLIDQSDVAFGCQGPHATQNGEEIAHHIPLHLLARVFLCHVVEQSPLLTLTRVRCL